MTKKLEKGLYEVRNETKRLGVYWKFEDMFRAQKHGKIDKVETFNTEEECEDFITGGKKLNKVKKIKGVVKKMSKENYEKPSVKKGKDGVNLKAMTRELIAKSTPKNEVMSKISETYKAMGKTDEKWIAGRAKGIYASMLKAKK